MKTYYEKEIEKCLKNIKKTYYETEFEKCLRKRNKMWNLFGDLINYKPRDVNHRPPTIIVNDLQIIEPTKICNAVNQYFLPLAIY